MFSGVVICRCGILQLEQSKLALVHPSRQLRHYLVVYSMTLPIFFGRSVSSVNCRTAFCRHKAIVRKGHGSAVSHNAVKTCRRVTVLHVALL